MGQDIPMPSRLGFSELDGAYFLVVVGWGGEAAGREQWGQEQGVASGGQRA